MTPIRILIADDHPIFRQSLRQVCEAGGFEIVGETGDGKEALALTFHARPDVILMDVSLPTLDSVQAIRSITQEIPETRVIVLAPHREHEVALEAIKAGARGYLLKDDDPDALLEAVRAVYRNEASLDSYLTAKVLDELCRLGQDSQSTFAELSSAIPPTQRDIVSTGSFLCKTFNVGHRT
jgi:DNA-binding NarL/FixJ family response regulator